MLHHFAEPRGQQRPPDRRSSPAGGPRSRRRRSARPSRACGSNCRARMPVRSSRRSPTPQPCSRLICERSSMSKSSRASACWCRSARSISCASASSNTGEAMSVVSGSRTVIGDLAAGDLLGVRAENLERRAADRVGDERPRLAGRAQPIVERDLVEDHALGLVHGVEQLPRRERRTVAREVAHRGALRVERAGVDARGEQPQQQLARSRASLPRSAGPRAARSRGHVYGQRVLAFADQRAGPAPNVAGKGAPFRPFEWRSS